MRNKKFLASIAAAMLLVSGTFAWQSFSQLATNEIIERVDSPGARLHDYFNGSDKDVFIENYASGNYAPDVYVRARLSEYYEYGKDAGSIDANSSIMTVVRGDIQQEENPTFSDPNTWDIYQFGSEAVEGVESIRTYRDLELGGSTVYMPTFNQDNTDLAAEVKGTYRDENGAVKEEPYDDYKSYEVDDTEEGKVVTKEGQAAIETTHTAKATEEATVMSMAEWKLLEEDKQIGDYWVFDTTGWAYYARPIVGHTATGLLLDKINIEFNPKFEWYYAVDVTAQLATFGDWGDEPSDENTNDGTGMYADMTEDSMEFLEIVSAADGTVKPEGQAEATSIEILNDDDSELGLNDIIIKAGESKIFGTSVNVIHSENGELEELVTWTINEVKNTTTYNTTNISSLSQSEIDATINNGVFNPVAAMAGREYEITATSCLSSRTSETIRVMVYDSTLEMVILEKGTVSSVKVENTQQFNAAYVGATIGVEVEWSVTEVIGNSGLTNAELNATVNELGEFTPLNEMSGGTFTITASTTGGQGLSAEIEIVVIGITVSLTSSTSSMTLSPTAYTTVLTPEVYETSNRSVTYTVEEVSGSSGYDADTLNATMSGSTFTATDMMTGGSYKITATSVADTTKSASVTIAIKSASIDFSDGELWTVIGRGESIQYTATIVGLRSSEVNWSRSGESSSLTTISNGKLNVAVAENYGNIITVTATSTSKETVIESSTITVQYGVSESESFYDSLVGTTNTIVVDGVEFYVLDHKTITTYNSSGVTQGSSKAALLWAVDPWKENGYVYSYVSDSTWATSELRTTLEKELQSTNTLLSEALYVDTSVYSYVTDSEYKTYDRFFPLSKDEFNIYNLAGSDRAKDSYGQLASTSGRALRSALTASTTWNYWADSAALNSGSNYNSVATTRPVRPALWIETGAPEAISVPGATGTAVPGSDSTISLDGIEFYILDTRYVTTYNSSGTSQGDTYAALLWAKEPWNGEGYVFNSTNSNQWSESTLRKTMDEKLESNSLLSSKALYVDTSVSDYTTGEVIKTYDRFYPISYEEFNKYQLGGTIRAQDNAGNIGGVTYRWQRTAVYENGVRTINASIGTGSSYTSAQNIRGVSPLIWVSL